MTDQRKPYYDPSVLQARRAERAAQLRQAVKQAFGFGKCKVIRNDEQGYKKA